jgi:predicted ATPase
MLNRSEQLLEIYIKAKGMTKSRNIIDLGFGFSQILPIIVLMWISVKEVTETGFRDNQHSKIVVIEQPEVHLHPRYIGLFATIMAQAIQLCKDKKIPINFIVETHSFSLLNKIGSLVYKEKLDKRNVVVYRFNMDEETNISSIETSDYDEDGALVDWPIDFFDED